MYRRQQRNQHLENQSSQPEGGVYKISWLKEVNRMSVLVSVMSFAVCRQIVNEIETVLV